MYRIGTFGAACLTASVCVGSRSSLGDGGPGGIPCTCSIRAWFPSLVSCFNAPSQRIACCRSKESTTTTRRGLHSVLVCQTISCSALYVFPSHYRPAIRWLGFGFTHAKDFLDELSKEQHMVGTREEDLSTRSQPTEDRKNLLEPKKKKETWSTLWKVCQCLTTPTMAPGQFEHCESSTSRQTQCRVDLTNSDCFGNVSLILADM